MAVAVLIRFRICIKQRWIGIGDDKLAQLQNLMKRNKGKKAKKKVLELEKVRWGDLKPRLKACYGLPTCGN